MPKPNFLAYHKSITAELTALKDRLGNLVVHGYTTGAFKEAILRSVLRKHLPANLRIGRGFIVTRDSQSTELDLIVVDQSKPVLFEDGDLLVVTPDSVRAVVEVKGTFESEGKLKEALNTLSF